MKAIILMFAILTVCAIYDETINSVIDDLFGNICSDGKIKSNFRDKTTQNAPTPLIIQQYVDE